MSASLAALFPENTARGFIPRKAYPTSARMLVFVSNAFEEPRSFGREPAVIPALEDDGRGHDGRPNLLLTRNQLVTNSSLQ